MDAAEREAQYRGVAAEYGPALERLARVYEADAAERRDLLQDIHFAVWRSLSGFDGRCSLRSWIYRVAHNTAVSHVLARRRVPKGMRIEELELADEAETPADTAERHQSLQRLTDLIRALHPADAQIMVLYLEDLDAAAIGEITGLSPGAVATKIHRLKTLLAKRFQGGAS